MKMRKVSAPAVTNQPQVAGVHGFNNRPPAVDRAFENAIYAVIESVTDDMRFDLAGGAKIQQLIQSFINFDRIDECVQLSATGAHQSHLLTQTITRAYPPRAPFVLDGSP